MTERPYHVVIVRLCPVADCVLALPLATAIKRAIPKAKVTWVVSDEAQPLVALCPDVDEALPLSPQWLRDPSQWRRLRHQGHQFPVDAVIDAQSTTASAMVGMLLGARTRVGFSKPQGRRLAPLLNTIAVPRLKKHLLDAHLRLLTPLGVRAESAEFRLAIPPEARRWAEHQVQCLVGRQAPVMMSPGAARVGLQWPTRRYSKVARKLRDRYSLPTVVVWRDADERQWAEQLADDSAGAAVVAPETSVVQRMALLERADTFLSGCREPLHLAAAVGTRCIALHAAMGSELAGPWGDRHLDLCKASVEYGCRRETDGARMRAIEVVDVCEAFEEMLARPDQRGAA